MQHLTLTASLNNQKLKFLSTMERDISG
jgi:hypothetical protein